MNRAKLMLSAIAVLAVVGGAFAFKATRQSHVFYRASSTTGGVCSITTTLFSTLTDEGNGVPTYLSTTKTTICPTFVTTDL